MRNAVEMGKLVTICVVLAAILIVWPWLNSKTVSNCQAINDGRKTGNERVSVQKRALRLDAEARERDARRELKNNPQAAVTDFTAANNFRQLMTEIHTLSTRPC